MTDHSVEVTIQGVTAYGSSLSNYSEAYEAWDEEEGEECTSCYGTGLDRDEIYDCPDCYGEGRIVGVDSVLKLR